MVYRKVIVQRRVSPDGRVVAEARTEVVTSEEQSGASAGATDRVSQVEQTVKVNITGAGASSYSSSVCSVNVNITRQH